MNNSSVDKINRLFELGVSRRKFLATAGAAGAASVLVGCSDNGTPSAVAASTAYTDTDILNFALNLEYLEAEFYLYAATNSGLLAADAGTGAGTTTGGAKVGGTLSNVQTQFINELAYTEQAHVRALRGAGALGSAAVARPNISLTAGFSGAVTAANTLTSTLPTIPTTFSPTANYDSFLVGAYVFEDVGVTAYNGAGPLLTAASVANGTLGTAAGIMAVEAYHGGAIRVQLTANAISNPTGSTGYPYPAYANRLSLLRAALGGGKETPMTGYSTTTATTVASIGATGTFSAVVPADANALAYARTTDQVLHIVYGTFSPVAGSTTPAAGVASGGFFPNGMNGNIKLTLS